jgi:hypothetical protein
MPNLTLPDGWTLNTYRDFLAAELREDGPAFTMPTDADDTNSIPGDGEGYFYFNLVDFDGSAAIFSVNWEDDLYRIGYSLSTGGDAGTDVKWKGNPEEVTMAPVKYIPVAEMAVDDLPQRVRKGTYALERTGAVQFSADAGDLVIRSGVVFEPGEYPDKQFSATADQLRAAAARFKPVKNRVNHPTGSAPGLTPSYFDGHMGELIALDFDDERNALVGQVAIPKWFDDFHQAHYAGEPLRNSLELDRDTCDVIGNVLVPNPRVTASALMSARAEFANSGGESVRIKESDPMGKTAATENPATPAAETPTVSLAQFQAQEAESAALREQVAQMAAERRTERAAQFAEKYIAAGRATPAMRGHMQALYTQASIDDAKDSGTVKFAKADGTEFVGSRVAALEASFAELPAVLMNEYVEGDHAIVTSARPLPADFAKTDANEAAEEARKDAQRRKDQQERNGR